MDCCLWVKRSHLDKRAVTAWQIYRNWDELWRDAEQILVGQEPEPQIYTTPNSEPGTIEHTGSAPPEVETGTPPIDVGQQVETPNNTGDRTREQPKAEDYVMESRRDVRGHENEGGHTIERHVGKSTEWLRNRARTDRTTDVASSFNTEANANLTQARFIKESKGEIQKWLENDSKVPFRGNISMDREIGIVVDDKGKVMTSNKARIILVKDNSELGYHILTSFPTP